MKKIRRAVGWPRSFDIPYHSPVRTPPRKANNSRSTRHSGIQHWSIKPRTKFSGVPENKNMRMQRSTYGTLRYDTTEATDDAHRVGGWVAVHTKKKRRMIAQGHLSHIIAMYKKRGWQCNNSWHSFPGCNAQSETLWLGRQTSLQSSCRTIDVGGAEVESHLQSYNHIQRRQVNYVSCPWQGSLVGQMMQDTKVDYWHVKSW